MPNDVEQWLKNIGLGEYADAPAHMVLFRIEREHVGALRPIQERLNPRD